MSIGALPSSHEDFQNDALRPSPTTHTVLALNNCLSTESQGTSMPTQDCSCSVHSSHNHLNRKALLNNSKSKIPRPPNFLGRFVLAHRTKQCPPFASAAPFHKKLHRTRSIFFIAHFRKEKPLRNAPGLKSGLHSLTAIFQPCSEASLSKLVILLPPSQSKVAPPPSPISYSAAAAQDMHRENF